MKLGGLLLALVLVGPVLAGTGAALPDDHPVRDVDHPDPGHSPSFALFPTHEEVQDAVKDHADHPWVTVHHLGNSTEGRSIDVLEITDPESPVPMDERVVTFIFTQQHGNEPAGTPAALDVLDEITSGDSLADLLANQILLLLPMANPDGAQADERHNAQDRDINRDHIGLETPEARAIHEVLTRWDVHVAMDHHEYGGIGAGNPVPVRAYDYDLTTLFPRHGNVRAEALDAAKGLMYDGIWPAAQEAGYSANEYGEQTAAGVPVQQIAGGPDPGIMRNHLGLHHVAGLLVETRIDAHPNPFHDAERREAIHKVVMDATLAYASEHAPALIQAKQASKAATLTAPDTAYIEGDIQAALAPSYMVRNAEGLDEVLALHGLPGTSAMEPAVLVPVAHDHQGHAAAIVHPDSTRSVVDDAKPLYPEEDEALATNQAATSGQDIPGIGAWVALALVAITALSTRRS